MADEVGPPQGHAALIALVATAVVACPAVAALYEGRPGDSTSLLPTGPVGAIAVSRQGVVVRVVGRYPATVGDIADQVRAAVLAVGIGVPVTVSVEDLVLPAAPRRTPPP